MWSMLIKDCNCSETSTNQGLVCHNAYNSDEFFYNGPNSSCTELQNHDDITVAIQKLENFLCSIELTQYFLTYIENNIELFPDFITLVNTAVSCQTITECFTTTTTTTITPTTTTTTSSTSTSTTTSTSSSTTTTTTTAIPVCTSYTLQSTVTNGSWTALNCENNPVAGITTFLGQTLVTGCIFDTSLLLNNMFIVNDNICVPTTTTTSSSTTSTTSSSTTTTTTTLAYECNSGEILVVNNTDVQILDIIGFPLYSLPFGLAPFSFDTGIHGGSTLVSFDIGNTPPGSASLYVNNALVETLNYYYADIYFFSSFSILDTDCVTIIFNPL